MICHFAGVITVLIPCSDAPQLSTETAVRAQRSAPLNGDFESPDMAPWEPRSWRADAQISPVVDRPHGGKQCLRITCAESNDASAVQKVPIRANTFYRLSGWVKTKDMGTDAVGANLCIAGEWTHSKDVRETHDWTRLSLLIQPRDTQYLSIGCRLGYWSNPNTGTAWFDDVRLVSLPSITLRIGDPKDRQRATELRTSTAETFAVLEGRYVTLRVFARKAARLKDPFAWIEKLDAACEAYRDLVGFTPFDGRRIVIQEVEDYPGGWAVAGNPILWHGIYIEKQFHQVNQGDWSFGILHELGHDFDQEVWNWHGEFFANFKMAYVAEKARAKILQGGRWYDHSNTSEPKLLNYYANSARQVDQQTRIKTWPQHNDADTYYFLLLTQRIGWEPFKKTFRMLHKLPKKEIPRTPRGKLRLFVKTLGETAGEDLIGWFTDHGFPVREQ